jgi:Zn-dependent protease
VDPASVVQKLLILAPPILIAITFHEVSHGYVAYKLGDPTAKFMGRLTLNPLASIDLFGTILLPIMTYILTGFVFGYAKPVPINPMNFKNPRKGMALSALAGPVTNIVLAVLSVILLKLIIIPLNMASSDTISETILLPFKMILEASTQINVILAVVNMIPIPPLDGGRVLVGLLPQRQAISFSKIERFGMIIILLLFYSGIANFFIRPVITFFLKLFQMY